MVARQGELLKCAFLPYPFDQRLMDNNHTPKNRIFIQIHYQFVGYRMKIYLISFSKKSEDENTYVRSFTEMNGVSVTR